MNNKWKANIENAVRNCNDEGILYQIQQIFELQNRTLLLSDAVQISLEQAENSIQNGNGIEHNEALTKFNKWHVL